MLMAENSQILQFSCACGQVKGSARVPASKLPIPFDFCHCNICRHQTGLLCASYLTLPEGSEDISFHGSLREYKSSASVSRSFCHRCGANVYVKDSNEARPDICTGVLDRAAGIIELRSHIFVCDTIDGGLSTWMSKVPAWEGFTNRSKQAGTGRQKLQIEKATPELEAYCQCRGVELKITSPSPESKLLRSPISDLFKSDEQHCKTAEKDDTWWLRANGSKYLAGTCACQSCRLNSGFDIQMWAFIPKVNISHMNGDALDFGNGTLSCYESSRGVSRYFCASCGATVFWSSVERPQLLDVSVGLLNASEGARAESWLEWWTERVSFEEEAINEDLVSNLGTGLRLWDHERHQMIPYKKSES